MTQTAAEAPEELDEQWRHHHFDHLSPALADDLHATLARMRSGCPVAHSDRHDGFWVVTRYDDVLTVAQDWATFSSAHGLTVPQAPIAVRNIPVEVDPPLHRVYKRLINAYFTPAAVAPWADRTRALVTRLIDGFVARGAADFMADFARPYPALSFFDVALGAPPEDVERVAYLASKSSTPSDPEAAACWAGLSEWIRAFVAQRRDGPPRGDVVDGVINADIEGRPITDEEIVGTLQLLILGGLETTAGALGMIMVRLCEHPDIPEALRRDPERIPEAVEELLRLDPPFIAVARTVTRDTTIGGHVVKAGEKVTISWLSANRDEDQFPDADSYNPARGSNRHLAFGAGPHRCAGSNLARMNLRIALEEIVTRLPDLHLEPGAEVDYHSTYTRAPLAVPIRFTPGRPVGAG